MTVGEMDDANSVTSLTLPKHSAV